MMTGEQLRAMKNLVSITTKLLNVLKKAEEHLDYIGYGDSWERECAKHDKLPKKIEQVIKQANKILQNHRRWYNQNNL